MGSYSSSTSKDENSKIKESQEDSSYDYELKTDNSFVKKKGKNNSIFGQSETKDNSKIIDLYENKISYKFEWREGGNEVQISGNFLNNWRVKKNMKKNSKTGFFEIILDVPKAVNQFKFIVDKKWICSPKYDTINDKNNINNVIDLRNYNEIIIYDDNDFKELKKKKKKVVKGSKKEYNCKFPNLNEINDDAPALPINYQNTFDLNNQSKQDLIKRNNKRYLKCNISRNKLENNSFKTIMTISHDKVLHICYNIEKNSENINNKFVRTAITQRNKHKFLTLIYYTPKK